MGFWKHHIFLGGVGIPRDWTDWEAGKSSFKVLDLLGEFGEWVALFRSLGRHDWWSPSGIFFPQKTMENRDRNSWYTQLENGDFP